MILAALPGVAVYSYMGQSKIFLQPLLPPRKKVKRDPGNLCIAICTIS